MYNLYNKNKTDDLGEKSEEGVDFYIPIGAILVELQDCPNNMSGIESNNVHLLAPPKPITLKLLYFLCSLWQRKSMGNI
ncbi:MAG: hypothetical protein WBZ36_30885 [Candidatus Nitrosopolaris sp.]